MKKVNWVKVITGTIAFLMIPAVLSIMFLLLNVIFTPHFTPSEIADANAIQHAVTQTYGKKIASYDATTDFQYHNIEDVAILLKNGKQFNVKWDMTTKQLLGVK